MSKLEQWLKNPVDVAQGLNLYSELGNNAVLFYALQIDPNTILVKRMLDELQAVLQADNGEQTEPEVVKLAREQWRAKYKQCSHLHAQLRQLPTDANRLSHALQILQLMDEVEQLWDVVDNWEATGQLPEVAQPDEPVRSFEGWDAVQLLKEKLLIASYISNQKKKISKGAKNWEQMLDWQQKLANKEQEYQNIKQLLMPKHDTTE